MPSHVVPSLTVDEEHNDVYSAYNKPGAVMYWLRVSCSAGHIVESLHRHCIRNHMLWASSVEQPGCRRQLKQFPVLANDNNREIYADGQRPSSTSLFACSRRTQLFVGTACVGTNLQMQSVPTLTCRVDCSIRLGNVSYMDNSQQACQPTSYLPTPSLVCTHDQKQLDAVPYNIISHPVNARKNSQAMP